MTYDQWKLATPPEYDITPEQEREEYEAMKMEQAMEKVEAALPSYLDVMGTAVIQQVAMLLLKETEAARERAENNRTDMLYRDIDKIENALESLKSFHHLRQHHPSALRGDNWPAEEHAIMEKALKVITEARARDDRIPF